jgi:Family of unknown function (DUF5681)
MLVRPHDGRINGVLLVGRWRKRSQRLEDRVPNPKLAPASNAHEDRVPIAVSLWHVAPRRAGAQNPKDAVHRPPLVSNGWAALPSVTITENGKCRKISKLDAAVTQLANDAARGDKKSIQLVFALLQALQPAIEAQRPVYFLGGVLTKGDRTI